MAGLLEAASAALIVIVLRAQVRFARRHPHQDRQLMLAGRVGNHVRIVSGKGQLKGLVRRVDRSAVSLRVVGSEVRVPLDQIHQVWDGHRLLASW